MDIFTLNAVGAISTNIKVYTCVLGLLSNVILIIIRDANLVSHYMVLLSTCCAYINIF